MEYTIDAVNNNDIDAVNALYTVVTGKEFLNTIKVDQYTYEFEYEVNSNKTADDSYCIPDLREEVFPLLSLIEQNTENKLLEVVRILADLSLKIGGRIYPDTLIWKSQEIPAGFDIAYALSLYKLDNCRHFGDYLLATDPDHDVYQVDAINSLLEKYDIGDQTIYMLGSYALHGSFGNDNIMELIRSKEYSAQIKNNASPLLDRLKAINNMAKGRYQKQLDRINAALQG